MELFDGSRIESRGPVSVFPREDGFEGGNGDSFGEANAAVLAEVKLKAHAFFSGAKGSHDWDHTLRVLALCRRIGKAEGADMTVLLCAALLHDIGRPHQDRSRGRICHARKGAELAESVVAALPLILPRKNNILHCIRTHRFRGEDRPETLEAMTLFDADKLDAIGAVGVARAYLFAGEIGARLHNPDRPVAETRAYSEDDTGYREYYMKLRGIKDRMLTRTGRETAAERHQFMTLFFERFLDEYEGKI